MSTSTGTSDSIPMDAANLIGQIVMANVDNLAATTDRIIDNLTDRAEDAEATTAAIRDRIGELLAGDFMPTPAALKRALRPNPATVAAYRALDVS